MEGKCPRDFIQLNTRNSNGAFWLQFDLIVSFPGNHVRQPTFGERPKNGQWIGGEANESWLIVAKRQHGSALELKDFLKPRDPQVFGYEKREKSIGFVGGILPRRETGPVVLEDRAKHIGRQSKHEKSRREPINSYNHGSAE